MSLLSWFTRNWADTDEGFHADLQPLPLSLSPADALAQLRHIIGQLPRWRVESSDDTTGTLHATRRTRLWRFRDDIHLRLESTATGTLLHARSQSRLGKGDLGQNRRNLLQLFRALRNA